MSAAEQTQQEAGELSKVFRYDFISTDKYDAEAVLDDCGNFVSFEDYHKLYLKLAHIKAQQAKAEATGIQRYIVIQSETDKDETYGEENPCGRWVTYYDHVNVVKALFDMRDQVKVKVTRYSLHKPDMADPLNPHFRETGSDDKGEWVKYEDFLAAKLNPSGFVLTKDDPAVYRMMQAILDITGDCEQNKTFSGWQLQAVQHKSTGEFVKIKLIATDKIGDVVAPRV